jgi:hypothetical protein
MIVFFLDSVWFVSEECGETRANGCFIRDFSLELDTGRAIGRHTRFNDTWFSQKTLAQLPGLAGMHRGRS